jgi:hypothetical protein
MGIRALAAPPRPEPKASCPSCGRPLAVIASGKCIYCGSAMPGVLAVVPPKSKIPAELLVQLEPRGEVRSTREKWLVRIVVFGISTGLVVAISIAIMKK